MEIILKIRIDKSIKMPTLYSLFISDFSQKTLEHFNKSKPFSFYHRRLQEYEITDDVLKNVNEEVKEVIDLRKTEAFFDRKSKEKYGYQKDAVDFAKESNNILMNFVQGSGKTRTSFMIIEDRDIFKTLVVCGQANLQEEWIRDAIKHDFQAKLNARIIGDVPENSGTAKIKWILENKNIKGVDIINIEALRNDKIVEAINEVGYNCIIVDEIQSAKGWKANQTEGLHKIKEVENQLRIALSGTPVLNGPLEFFSVLKFLRQLKDTARTTYEKYYGIWSFDFWGHYVCTGYRNIDKLQQLLQPIIAHVSKSELNLPKKIRVKVNLEQPEQEEFQYLNKVYRMSNVRLKKEGFTSKAQIRAKMQLITSTADVKVKYILKVAEEKKVLVFSQYVEALKIVKEKLEEKNKKVLLYTGQLSSAQRKEILDEWYKGEYDILLLSVMAARYGLNLVEATETLFLEPPVSLAVLEQAEDRTHRIGQDNEVTSHLLVWGESDEERLNAIVAKQRAIDKVYDFL